MRGKDVLDVDKSHKKGITPAYAGKSIPWAEQKEAPQDHPRLCGEKVRTVKLVTSAAGIPPAYAGKSFVR